MAPADARKSRELEPYLNIIEALLGQEDNRMATAQTIYQTIPRAELVQALREVGAATQDPLRTVVQIFPETRIQYGNRIHLIG